jgi:tRNA(adenine34) deaminase
MSHSDELWMEEALREAQRALALGEVPVGAVVVEDGRIVGHGCNRPLSTNDPTAHAEILALREAGQSIGNYRLLLCDLYVTVEPCAMCAGAITHARIRRLIYGAEDAKAGAVHSMLQVLNHPKLNHKVEVSSGVLAARCMDLVQAFFREKREAPSRLDPPAST